MTNLLLFWGSFMRKHSSQMRLMKAESSYFSIISISSFRMRHSWKMKSWIFTLSLVKIGQKVMKSLFTLFSNTASWWGNHSKWDWWTVIDKEDISKDLLLIASFFLKKVISVIKEWLTIKNYQKVRRLSRQLLERTALSWFMLMLNNISLRKVTNWNFMLQVLGKHPISATKWCRLMAIDHCKVGIILYLL